MVYCFKLVENLTVILFGFVVACDTKCLFVLDGCFPNVMLLIVLYCLLGLLDLLYFTLLLVLDVFTFVLL